MRILMLSSGYGGDRRSIGGRCAALAGGLVSRGDEVVVIAAGAGELADPKWVERVPDYPPMIPAWDQISGALHAGLGMLERGIAVLMRERFDVIHAHGWTTAYPAVALQRAFAIPLVSTVDAVSQRIDGRGGELIHQTGWWLAVASSRVIVPSAAAREAALSAFDLAPERIDVMDLRRSRDPASRVAHVYRAATSDGSSAVTRLEPAQVTFLPPPQHRPAPA